MGFLAKLMETHSNGGTNYNKFTLLSSDESADATIADYVVEQGTDGIWTYRKWASGRAECWGEQLYSNQAVNTAWGNVYYSSLGTISFPFEFKSRPMGNIFAMSTSARVWLAESTDRSKTATGTIYAIAPTIYSNIASITIYLYVAGRWK